MKLAYPNANCSAADSEGVTYPLRENEPWDANDPLVLAHPDLFSDEPTRVMRTVHAPVVEQATRAPGEQRNIRRG